MTDPEPAPLHPPTVLLVEAAQDDRQMYAEYLRQFRFRAIETDSMEEALARAPTADVIVTGIRLPGPFDGVELVRRLRANARTRAKPIVVLTACSLEICRRRALMAGCDRFMVKPCLPDALLSEVQRLLATDSGRRRGHG